MRTPALAPLFAPDALNNHSTHLAAAVARANPYEAHMTPVDVILALICALFGAGWLWEAHKHGQTRIVLERFAAFDGNRDGRPGGSRKRGF